MHELLVLARLRDAVGEIVTLFQIPRFSVALEDTGNMVPDVFGELKPETIVLGSAPTGEEIEQWCKDVKQAFKEIRQELASCRTIVTSRTPKFHVGYTKISLEGFEENVLPVLAEIATSQHLHDYVEGLKQRRGELDSVLSDFTYESKTEAAEGKPNSPANVSTVERESLESEQPPLVPHPTEDTSAKAALNRLNRFVELMEATNARDEIEREQSYGREPSVELTGTAKPWIGKDSIEELRRLAGSLSTEAEFYKCSEGGQYLSLVAVNYWQCHQRGHSAENAMMVRRTIAELRPKLLAAIRHEESNQVAKPKRTKPLLPQQEEPQPARTDRIVVDGTSPLSQYVRLLTEVPEKLERALSRDAAAIHILTAKSDLSQALARVTILEGCREREKQTEELVRSPRIWTRRDERRVNMLRGFGGGCVPACRVARYIAWLEPRTGPSFHDRRFRLAFNEAQQNQTIGVLGEKLEKAKTVYSRMIAVARSIAQGDADKSFTDVRIELGSITCDLLGYTKEPTEKNDRPTAALSTKNRPDPATVAAELSASGIAGIRALTLHLMTHNHPAIHALRFQEGVRSEGGDALSATEELERFGVMAGQHDPHQNATVYYFDAEYVRAVLATLPAKPSVAGDDASVVPEPPEANKPSGLSWTKHDVLQYLKGAEAMVEARRKTAREITTGAAGPAADVNGFKGPLAEMVRAGLLESKTGSGGGYWLTEAGKNKSKERQKR